MIAVIDYDVGNLHSVKNALTALGADSVETSDERSIRSCSAIILPGVGAFPDAMASLKSRGLDEVICSEAKGGKPILGICLGMQLLFDSSDELRQTAGLGLIPGKVRKIRGAKKLPHIGWNDLTIEHPCELTRDLSPHDYVYFVHSFMAEVENSEHLLASTFYGEKISALVGRDNVYGAQFHPEKSSRVGLNILKRFVEMSEVK